VADKITAGLIGLGNYGRVIAARMAQSGRYRIKTCVHANREKADEFAATFDSIGCDNFALVLADSSIDAVFILTPNDSHFELAEKALQADKHVFVEKPMTNTVNEARKLGQLLKKKNKVFMVGHNFRRKNGVRFIKKLLDNGEFGNPVHFEMVISHGGAFNFDKYCWRNDPRRCLGGPLAMLGPHSFDVLHYLMGKPANDYSINQNSQSLSK